MKNDVERFVERLKNFIHQSEHGRITFEQYMSACLYDPEFGYYNRSYPKVGKDGDFYTSASIGSVMGEMIAAYILEQAALPLNKPFVFIEWGPGTGKLACDLLTCIAKRAPDTYEQLEYWALETSRYHQRVLETNLKDHRDKLKIVFPHDKPEDDKNVVIIANEFLDALPVRRLTKKNQILYEHWVEWNADKQWFQPRLVEANDAHLLHYIQRHGIHVHEGQTVEVNLQAADWIRRSVQTFEEALWILIDYGDETDEIYGEHRMEGTLMSYYRHAAFSDPYLMPGQQDLTAHVDFAACAREAAWAAADLQIEYMTQKEFLIKAGIFTLLESHDERDPFHPAARRNRAVRQLLISDQMSELFKVLVLKKEKK